MKSKSSHNRHEQQQQQQQPSLRPEAKTFIPASFPSLPPRVSSSSSLSAPNVTNTRDLRSKYYNTNKKNIQPSVTPKSVRRRKRVTNINKRPQNDDTINEYRQNHTTSQQSLDKEQPQPQQNHMEQNFRPRNNPHRRHQQQQQQMDYPQSTTKRELSSTSTGTPRNTHRLQNRPSIQRQHRRPHQTDCATNGIRNTLDDLKKEIEVNSDVLLPLSSSNYFPSLRSSPNMYPMKDTNVSTLTPSTVYTTKTTRCDQDKYSDTVWKNFDKFALPIPTLSSEVSSTSIASTTTLDGFGSSTNQDINDITRMVTLLRISNTSTTTTNNNHNNNHGTGMTRSVETKNNIVSSECSNRPELPSDHHTTLHIPSSRRHPSIDKLRDRWWNLVREHEDHEGMKEEFLQDKPVHVQTQKLKEIDGRSTAFSKDAGYDETLSPLVMKKLKSVAKNDITEKCVDTDIFVQALCDGMQQNDTDRVKYLLSRVPDDINIISSVTTLPKSCAKLSILDWAVHSNNAPMLRIICGSIDVECTVESVIPFLLAVERGHDECLQVLLSYFGISSLLTCRDEQGNTALHNSCISTANRTTFSVLLDCIISSTGYTKSLLFKIFSCRNHQNQTPLHVAALYQRADVIDLVLNHRGTSNISMLTKLMALQDMEQQTPLLAAIASGSTDIVMSLLMWRGNNQPLKQLAPTTKNCLEKDAVSASCPLAWAVRHKNIDMVSLLLEFNNPHSESGYKLNNALSVAVMNTTDEDGVGNKNDNDSTTLDIIRILVAAGANPCATDIDDKQSKSALALATLHGNPGRLSRLLRSYDDYLRRIRLQRRQDPKLQRQPESFFIGMESTENTERLIAGKEALLLSLPIICSGVCSKNVECHDKCSLALYENGIKLGPSDLVQLKSNMKLDNASNTTYKSSCLRLGIPRLPTLHEKDTVRYYWSHLMSVLPWFDCDGAQKCAFFNSTERIGNMSFALTDIQQPDVVIICNDGFTLLAHRIVLTQSQKLHAAIRFACMRDAHRHVECTASTTERDTVTLNVDLPYDMCRILLIHMYHGSILDELPADPHEFCLHILELILVADEYICTSLIRECILRLLASVDTFDRCFCSYCQGSTDRHGNDDKYVSCTLDVAGPSHLITADLALDVLAIAQHVNWCPDCDEDDDNHTIKQTTATKRKKSVIDYLREVALSVAICDFGTVVRCPTFIHQFENADLSGNTDGTSSSGRASGKLLRSLLNDLFDMGRMSSRNVV